MKYLLDTNICVCMLKHVPAVISNFTKKQEYGFAISSITLAELEYGVCNSNSYDKNRAALISFLPLVEILPFNTAAAMQYGKICASLRKKGTLIGSLDMLIAAHAKSCGLVVVTNNIREFERVEGLMLENWV
jgi:tRNA(fMet)-specific endonuclease VapC